VKSWIYRTWETLRSVLSWTHWRQKKALQQWETEQRLLLQMRLQNRMLLMEALTPLAAALQRLDNLQQQQWQKTHLHLLHQEELLEEILNSLQPPASQQIFQRIGQPTPPPTSRNWAS
jgi:hypothetical protein